MINPLEQFLVKPVITFNIFTYNVCITNSTMTFISIYLIILLLTRIACYNVLLSPGKIQACGEIVFLFIKGVLSSTAGKSSHKFFPFIFSLFIFILISNSIGMIPSVFTTTSHISVTLSLSIFTFIIITVLGFINHGFNYFSILLPKGTPILMSPLVVIIELFAYFVRPISLSIRLAANMTAGHVVLKVIANFVIISGLLGVVPLILLTILTGFEIFISVLQAYIFSVLTCVYLSNALNLH